MRILFWSELFWPYIGGAEVVGAKLLPALQARGYEVAVVTSHDHLKLPDEDRYNGIPIYRFPFRTALAEGNITQLVKARHRLAELKRTLAPQLIHLNALGPSFLFNLQTADAHPAPVLVTLHTVYDLIDSTQTEGRDTLLQNTLRSVAWVACVSEAVLHDARRRVPMITGSSSIVYNGLDEPNILPKPLPLAAPRLLCLGRLTTVKGFDLALSAFSMLIDRFPLARLVIAGDGLMRPALQAQALQLGLDDRVEFTGWIAPDKVPELINSATVVIMPSRREGFPLVGIQAAQVARPIVASRAGGLPELVVHEKTGLLVERENIKSLAEAIAFLLDRPDRARQMGKAARRRVQQIFSLERCVNEYDALYRKLSKKFPYVESA